MDGGRLICNRYSTNTCTYGDLCKFKHGPADPRWDGDVMKPAHALIVQQAVESSRRKFKRVNMLTQHAIDGADEEQA